MVDLYVEITLRCVKSHLHFLIHTTPLKPDESRCLFIKYYKNYNNFYLCTCKFNMLEFTFFVLCIVHDIYIYIYIAFLLCSCCL